MTTGSERDIDAALKVRMRDRLRERRWTLEDLARAADESYSNIRNWITGETRIPAWFLVRYAEVVPVSPVWLLTGDGSPEPRDEHLPELTFELITGVLRQAADPGVRRSELRRCLNAMIELLEETGE